MSEESHDFPRAHPSPSEAIQSRLKDFLTVKGDEHQKSVTPIAPLISDRPMQDIVAEHQNMHQDQNDQNR